MKKEKRHFAVLTAAAVILGAVYVTRGNADEGTVVKQAAFTESAVSQAEETSGSGGTEDSDRIFVYVSGEVFEPGVYELPQDARVFDALIAAGGLTERAAKSAVNQAEKVRDGEMIFVPAEGTEQVLGAVLTDGRIDINTASVEELIRLPGIGEAKAEMIIRYREQHGAFSCPEDLLNVSGIGSGIFEQIREKIKV